MNQNKVNRRHALGLIAKTGMTLGAGTCFFLCLKTSPLAGEQKDLSSSGTVGCKIDKPGRDKSVAEKVVISGSDSTIVFRISGAPGRHFGIAHATADTKERYRAVAEGQGVIGKNGLGTIKINVKDLPSGKVYLRVVTGNGKDFSEAARGTQAFQVQTAEGCIKSFKGVRQRPLETGGVAVAAATVGYTQLKR